MAFTDRQLTQIYDRASGYCHICHRKLSYNNYGRLHAYRAWEVDHSVARAKGGSRSLKNCLPACISCNRSKGARSTKSARTENGVRSAPLDRSSRARAKSRNAIVLGAVGGALGAVVAGPLGAVIGAGLGAHVGDKHNPDRRII